MFKVFVYGTLKPGEENYAEYCAGKIVDAKPVYTLGELFALPQGYPAMIKGDNRVYGYLLTFADLEVLTKLDELEDYYPSRQNSENLYQREQIEIFNLESNIDFSFQNQPFQTQQFLGLAWTYLMTKSQVHQLNGVRQIDGWWTGKSINIEQFRQN
ncbi:hypothetical protein NIES4101_87430 [Calothrix sp. NIES-4101]|nr:hypothetical protein NIES4101_87430 [Calothrix sp. NIES-4101]